MKKNIILLILILMMVFVFVGCTNANKEEPEAQMIIAKIISYDDGVIYAEAIMGYTGNVYMNITDETYFPNGEITEFPAGFLITAYYNEVMESDPAQINLNVIEAVDEDGEITTQN